MNRKETTHAHLNKSLDGVLASPLPGCRLIPGPVGLVDVCNLGDERVVGVGVGQHRADAQQHCAHISIAMARQAPGGGASIPLLMVSAGLHWSRRMSKQMLPFELMLGW